ncbi:unnamed protein product [Linum trigynum]|uniref:Uncharacterized protein n=1 Tax=Linum trigynum TaxID=586398 RepID=A0AAV2CSW8_9ROSI
MASGSAAADGFFRNWVFEGSLSGADYGIERRPYHRNCKCALHEKSRDGGGGGSCGNCKNTVSYKIRRSWSEGSLALASAATSGAGSGSSPSCSSNSSPHAAGHGLPPSPSLQALARSMSRDDLASYSGSR